MREIRELDGSLMMIDVDKVVAIRESGIEDHSELITDGGAQIVIHVPYDKCFNVLHGIGEI